MIDDKLTIQDKLSIAAKGCRGFGDAIPEEAEDSYLSTDEGQKWLESTIDALLSGGKLSFWNKRKVKRVSISFDSITHDIHGSEEEIELSELCQRKALGQDIYKGLDHNPLDLAEANYKKLFKEVAREQLEDIAESYYQAHIDQLEIDAAY
jgi:hypothetical protein